MDKRDWDKVCRKFHKECQLGQEHTQKSCVLCKKKIKGNKVDYVSETFSAQQF